MKKKTKKKKKKKKKKTIKGKTDLLQDRPDLPGGRTSHDKQYCTCLDYSQNLAMSPRRGQCQDGLTD